MSAAIPLANTVGVIAQRLGEPLHRVAYVIRSRNLQPVARAGNARVFDEAGVNFIRSELRRIDEEREAMS